MDKKQTIAEASAAAAAATAAIARTTTVMKESDNFSVQEINWEDVRVGDVLKIQHGELAPADMILLDSNNIRDKLPICYINELQTEGKEQLREVKSSNLTRSKPPLTCSPPRSSSISSNSLHPSLPHYSQSSEGLEEVAL